MNILTKDLCFPPVEQANYDGILAFGGDLSEERLLLAYRSGVFPWFSEGEPITWFAPEERMVVFVQEYETPRTIKKLMRKNLFQITYNSAFSEVIHHCKTIERAGQWGTWITDEMEIAYNNLHQKGFAKSVEVWQNGLLVGGIYGVDLGHVFCGESMFSKVSGASKIAFCALIAQLKAQNYVLLDAQVYNEHLALLGAEEIDRADFMKILNARS